MIPVKLELQNFLAYRDPDPLDLTGLHLACLVGENGAGKSSLLDAITWSLWGKARTRRDDELIHGDEEEMQVIFTFALSSNLYRVIRYRSRKGRGTSMLNLEVLDGEDWRAIGESTIRATQERINGLLRLDYDTFINSAFLVQGRADEFTQKTPGERKEILGEILGLDRWQRYEERAKEQLKMLDAKLSQIDHDLDRIDAELAREDEYFAELDEVKQKRDELIGQLEEAESFVRELERSRQHRQSLVKQRESLETRIDRDEQNLKHTDAQREKYARRLDEYAEVIASRDEIEHGYQTLQEARAALNAFNQKLIEQKDLNEHRVELRSAVNEARRELETKQRSLQHDRQKLKKTIDEATGNAPQLEEKQAEVAELEALEAQRSDWSEELSELRAELSALTATNVRLRSEMDQLDEQRDQVAAASEPICPLCEQHLSDKHRADLIGRLEKEGGEKSSTYWENKDQIEELKSRIEELDEKIDNANIHLRNLPPLRQHVTRLSERLVKADEAQEELEIVNEQLAEVTAALDSKAFAEEAQAELAEVQAQLADVGYDEKAHQQAQQTINDNEQYERLHTQLEQVLEDQPEVEEELERLDKLIEAQEVALVEDQQQVEELQMQITEIDEQIDELQGWEARQNDLKDAERQANQRVGMIEQKITTLAHQRERRADLLDEREEINNQQGVYEELREAFSKNGIPAMLIEAAIPEIENEANELLARMTDGRMHVRFQTQRENVTGGVRETLDIQIADELGTRDYETFSGGESFRVDFAIRLALSRLLARRAGTQLRTLILDEGFGTQDARGRERLVQAINAIKEDFDLILVITHIEELKDAFPARIEVTKTRAGSIAEIV